MKEKPKRGGKREGAGRKPMGKGTYSVTLTATNVVEARKRESNLSGLLNRLLARWLKK
jgi:Post-segregation antitoxin CcdA